MKTKNILLGTLVLGGAVGYLLTTKKGKEISNNLVNTLNNSIDKLNENMAANLKDYSPNIQTNNTKTSILNFVEEHKDLLIGIGTILLPVLTKKLNNRI